MCSLFISLSALSALKPFLIYVSEIVKVGVADEDVLTVGVFDADGVVDPADNVKGLVNGVGVEENVAERHILMYLVPDAGKGIDIYAGDGGDLVKPFDGGDGAAFVGPEHIAAGAAAVGVLLGFGQLRGGVDFAEGRLFFNVDSDDYLTDDALEKVALWESALPKDQKFCGIVANGGQSPTETPNTRFEEAYLDSNAFDM